MSSARRAVSLVFALILALTIGSNVAIADSIYHSGPPAPGGGDPGSISAQIAAIDQQLTSVQQRESALDGQQTSLDQRTNAYNQQSKDVLGQLDAVGEQIDEHNAKLDSYPNGAPPDVANSLNAEAANLNSEKAQLQEQADAIAAEGESIKSDESQLQSQKGQLDSQLGSLTTQRQQLLQQFVSVLLASLAAPPQTVRQAQGGDPGRPASSIEQTEQTASAGGDPVTRQAKETALDDYARRQNVEVDKQPVTATLSPRSVAKLPTGQAPALQLQRTFDGLVRKPNGAYKALAVTPAGEQPATQRAFDDAVTGGGSAIVVQNGKQAVIDEIEHIPEDIHANADKAEADAIAAAQQLVGADGKFKDARLEGAYQRYVARKAQVRQPPRERPDWKVASDYWTTESPLARGNQFNETASALYPFNEVHLKNGKRLDSYVPPTGENSGEIISRKATDFDAIETQTFKSYLSELKSKYAPGTIIRSDLNREIDGQALEGKQILEVPDSNLNSVNRVEFERLASAQGIEIRYTPE